MQDVKRLIYNISKSNMEEKETLVWSWLIVRNSLMYLLKEFFKSFFTVVLSVVIFLICTYIYGLYSWIGRERISSNQIAEIIYANLNNKDAKIKVFKEDLRWFGEDAILVFTGLPHDKEGWMSGESDLNEGTILQSDFPKIEIFEKVQKNPLENLIFPDILYERTNEFELKKVATSSWYMPLYAKTTYAMYTTEQEQNIFWYELGGVRKLNTIWRNQLIFSWISMDWVSTTTVYYWMLTYDIKNWYDLVPLLSDGYGQELSTEALEKWIKMAKATLQWLQLKESFKLFSNSKVQIIKNGRIEDRYLTMFDTDSPPTFSTDFKNIQVFSNLWLILWWESHAEDHDYLIERYQYNENTSWYELDSPQYFISRSAKNYKQVIQDELKNRIDF